MTRFEGIPDRLRNATTLLVHANLTDGKFLSITGLMEDAALKIEALERDAKRHFQKFGGYLNDDACGCVEGAKTVVPGKWECLDCGRIWMSEGHFVETKADG